MLRQAPEGEFAPLRHRIDRVGDQVYNGLLEIGRATMHLDAGLEIQHYLHFLARRAVVPMCPCGLNGLPDDISNIDELAGAVMGPARDRMDAPYRLGALEADA